MSKSSILHKELPGILPAGVILALAPAQGIVARLHTNSGKPRMSIAHCFGPVEMALVLALVESFPDYCPNEHMLAWYNGGRTEQDIEHARAMLTEAREAGRWDEHMRPMRRVLSLLRRKLMHMGIDVRSIFETGYMLIPYTDEQYRRLRRA